MDNHFKKGYLYCAKRILENVEKQGDKIDKQYLIEQLQELILTKDCEFADTIEYPPEIFDNLPEDKQMLVIYGEELPGEAFNL